jgi:CrcB protein
LTGGEYFTPERSFTVIVLLSSEICGSLSARSGTGVSASSGLNEYSSLGTAVSAEWSLTLGLGLLGGYTTFSTVSVETVLLAQRKRWRDAAVNLFGTLVVAVLAAGAGVLSGAALAGA